MNSKKETLPNQSEKAAVRALIEAGFEASPQKISLPVLDSWVITKSKKSAKKEKIQIKKKIGLPPMSKASFRSSRNSSSLCKSSKESYRFRAPLISLAVQNEPKELPKSRLKSVRRPNIRSNSLGDTKKYERSIDITEIKKNLISVIIKNNLLTKLKQDSKKNLVSEKFDLRFLKPFLNR